MVKLLPQAVWALKDRILWSLTASLSASLRDNQGQSGQGIVSVWKVWDLGVTETCQASVQRDMEGGV